MITIYVDQVSLYCSESNEQRLNGSSSIILHLLMLHVYESSNWRNYLSIVVNCRHRILSLN